MGCAWIILQVTIFHLFVLDYFQVYLAKEIQSEKEYAGGSLT